MFLTKFSIKFFVKEVKTPTNAERPKQGFPAHAEKGDVFCDVVRVFTCGRVRLHDRDSKQKQVIKDESARSDPAAAFVCFCLHILITSFIFAS